MKSSITASFEGFPKTRQIVDHDGRIGFIITPRTLTPVKAMVADRAAVLMAISIAPLILFFLEKKYTHNWEIGVLLTSPFVAYPLLKIAFAWIFMAKAKMTLTPSMISFKRGGRKKAYDRTQPHSYSVIEHDKSRREQERHELAAHRAQAEEGEIIAKTKYYGDSFHICFNPIGQRKDILTVYGRKPALAILMRLKACDEIIEAHAGLGDGLALSPDPQWAPQPGDLPSE